MPLHHSRQRFSLLLCSLIICCIKLLSLVAIASSFTTNDGATLSYTISGKGPVVLLLSGGPGFASSMLTKLSDIVAQNNTAILFDQRGTGKSRSGNKIDKETIKMSRFVEDIEELRVKLNIEKLILIGHSWGGALAMAYTAAHPEKVNSMVLLCSGGVDLSYRPTFSGKLNGKLSTEEKSVKSGWIRRYDDSQDPDPEGAFFGIFSSSWAGYVHDRGSVAELDKYLKKEYSHRDINELMSADMEGDVNDPDDDFSVVGKLSAFKGLAFILFGESDPMDHTIAEKTQKEITQAKIITIPKSGHYPWIEKPDEFAKVLNDVMLKINKTQH
ncbi:MAG: alpha/beta fold hydrolase [Chitinophagaceae bacterium]|nr:MAG: alpha/beta fold hydrolase [Chitinophagaceae bacterium]